MGRAHLSVVLLEPMPVDLHTRPSAQIRCSRERRRGDACEGNRTGALAKQLEQPVYHYRCAGHAGHACVWGRHSLHRPAVTDARLWLHVVPWCGLSLCFQFFFFIIDSAGHVLKAVIAHREDIRNQALGSMSLKNAGERVIKRSRRAMVRRVLQ